MTEWVLITMLCIRVCVPKYAEAMPNKAACEKHISDKGGAFTQPSHYCVPKIKERNQ
jgi:hypothetical protein